MENDAEGYTLNCRQRLPPEERVWRGNFHSLLMNILGYSLIFAVQ